MTDEALLAQYARAGSKPAFAELVRRHAGMIYSTCHRILGEHHAAEDAAQATLLVLMRRADRLPAGTVLVGWLFRTAELTARDERRRRARQAWREREAAMRRSRSEEHPGAKEVLPLLDAALRALPRVQLDALLMHYWGGKSQEEIAAEMGCPRTTIGSRIAGGLRRLREQLARSGAVVPAAALAEVLGSPALRSAPAGLVESLGSACLGAAGISAAAAAMAQGTMSALLWAKVKLAAVVLCVAGATAAAGTAAAVSLMAAGPEPDRVPIAGFEEDPLPLAANADGGQPPAFERSAQDPKSGKACLKLTYRNGPAGYGNLRTPARMCGAEQSVTFWLRRESAEEKACFHIWLMERDGDAWLSPAVELKALAPGWQRVTLDIARFKYEPRGNKVKEIATVDRMLLGCNYGSFVLFVDDLAFAGRGLKAAWDKANAPVEAVVSVDESNTLVERFMGFGAEWDSNGYAANGVTDQDFEVIARRIRWMRLPIARVMMQAKYVYQGGGKLDFETPAMKDLYRHLDLCQKEGIAVMLTEWGCEPQWLRPPEISRVEDPKYAGIIGSYLSHLVEKKGYTCIRYFVLVNEPNYEVGDFNRWKKGVQNVAAQLAERKLDGKVLLAGSDHSNADDWHARAVKELSGTLGAYDFHRYASPDEVLSGRLESYIRGQWAVAAGGDPKVKARSKPLIVGEAGLLTPGFSASNNPMHLDYLYGVCMADYATQAASAGSWAVLAWMLDDNSHKGFTWGMWANHQNGLKPKPWFYVWALLSRSFPAGSRIVAVKGAPAGVRLLAAKLPGEKPGWSFCLVNRTPRPAKVTVSVPGGGNPEMRRYLYSRSSAATDRDGFPVPAAAGKCDLEAGVAVELPAESVTVLTSVGD